ncbi:bifunctional aspartate kinase/homoserine dehydrogenase I [Kangiella sp.]|uniref:bifunctional aspartate kinase/homoserine dehydrogenase I n=1 Tax=Kangiella sp. TaxID=1920245 RepID=UPI003A91B1FB
MKVLKFGGSSLADAQSMLQVADIIGQERNNTLVVLSAIANTTNELQLFCTSQTSTTTESILESIARYHAKLAAELGLSNDSLLKQKLDFVFQQMQELKAKPELGDSDIAVILSAGEYLSCYLLLALLQKQGMSVAMIDSKDYIVAEGATLDSRAELTRSMRKWQEAAPTFSHINLAPGFIAATQSGDACLLGRNGSDYSAALFSYLTDAQACEIWTDVSGIHAADPRIVENAKLMPSMTYQEAMELAHHGAKVLHPKTIFPLQLKSIPLRIKNTFAPADSGTLIQPLHHGQDSIKGVSYQPDICLLNVSGAYLRNSYGSAARIFETLAAKHISIILISQSSSEYSICFAIRNSECKRALHILNSEFENEIRQGQLNPIQVDKSRAIVSLVGQGLKNRKGVAYKFLQAISHGNINIEAIAQGSSESSISVVIKGEQAKQACQLVYAEFFNRRQRLDLFIIGCGNVGQELIRQVYAQQSFLQDKNIALRICLVANSKRYVSCKDGLLESDWQTGLQQSSNTLSKEILSQLLASGDYINPTLVDCTCSEKVSEQYADYIEMGFNLVTANKKANSGPYSYYQQLKMLAHQKFRKYLYETNVGAGLPVLKTIDSLITSGDAIHRVEGILSGSLSFILGQMEEGKSFSEAVLETKSLGFTEPDPRDDLGGMDVARKLLILAREVGAQYELSDIVIEGLLPSDFNLNGSTEEFMQRLPQVDHYFAELFARAKSNNETLKYIACFNDNKLEVSLQSVSQDNPLYSVKNGENAIAIYSHYYSPIPLVLKGYGAGAKVTAAGLFADVLQNIPHREQEISS